jgi:hypothetical protein
MPQNDGTMSGLPERKIMFRLLFIDYTRLQWLPVGSLSSFLHMVVLDKEVLRYVPKSTGFGGNEEAIMLQYVKLY